MGGECVNEASVDASKNSIDTNDHKRYLQNFVSRIRWKLITGVRQVAVASGRAWPAYECKVYTGDQELPG